MNEYVSNLIKISLKFVPKCPISNIPALVQIMVWRQQCEKPLSEPMMVSLLAHIYITRPQWVKTYQKASLLLAEKIVTASCHFSKTESRTECIYEYSWPEYLFIIKSWIFFIKIMMISNTVLWKITSSHTTPLNFALTIAPLSQLWLGHG